MGNHDLSSMVTTIVMIVLFTIAIIGFSLGFASDNNAAISIADDSSGLEDLDADLRASASSLEENSEETHSLMKDTTIEPGSDVIKSPSVFILTFPALIDSLENIFKVGFGTIFGFGGVFGIFFTVMMAMIGILLVWYVYKAIRGNP